MEGTRLAWKGALDGETRLKKLQVRVAEDAVCICCVVLGNKSPQISWLKTTSLSCLPVSVRQGVSTAWPAFYSGSHEAAVRCQDCALIWSSDRGRVLSKSIRVVDRIHFLSLSDWGLSFLPSVTLATVRA